MQQKDPNSFLFVLAFGGDGAPGCALNFSFSFINVSRRITSSSENFIIFGCDADECSKISHRFILKVMSDIKALGSEVFILYVHGVRKKVELSLGELPNDMKFLGFLAWELPSAYFLTFANVNQDSKKEVKRVFGFDDSKEKWEMFNYQKRIEDVAVIEKKKDQYSKLNITAKTRRTKVLKDIRNLHSRQEFVPLVEPYIDVAKSEELHLKNNIVKEMFIGLHKLV